MTLWNNALSPFFLVAETELSVTAELVPTSSWNISSEVDKGTWRGKHGPEEEEDKTHP